MAQGRPSAEKASADVFSYPLTPPPAFGRVGTAQGLPSGSVTAIAQDSSGRIWIGTKQGLVRLDGAKVTTFVSDPAVATTLSDSYISQLATDFKGRLWIGTSEGLDVVEGGAFRRVLPLPKIGVSALAAVGERVLVGTSGGDIQAVDVGTGKATVLDIGIKEAAVSAIVPGAGGEVWVATLGEGVVKLTADLKAADSFGADESDDTSLPSSNVTAVLPVSGGKEILVGTSEHGLAVFDPATGRKRLFEAGSGRSGLTDDRVTVLLPGEGDEVWVGTENGLNRVDLATGIVGRYVADNPNPQALAHSHVTAAFTDRAGVRWFGTFASGACTFAPLSARFTSYRTVKTVGSAQFVDPDGSIWIGSQPGYLSHYDRNKLVVTVYNRIGVEPDTVDLEPAWITSIHRGEDKALWIGTVGLGLLRWDPSGEVKSYADELGTRTVFRIAPSKRGGFYVATGDAGLAYYDAQTRKFRRWTEENSELTSNALYTVVEDIREKNFVWVGGVAGLNQVDVTSGTVSAFQNDPKDPKSLSANRVTAIHQDNAGSVWIGTYEAGLNRLDTAKKWTFERYPAVVNVTVWGILSDKTGALWISTEGKGLLRFDPGKKSVLAFDQTDGALRQYAQSGFHQASTGEMLFGGPEGFTIFRPETIVPDSYPPPTVFTSFKVVGKDQDLQRRSFDLPYDESAVAFEFAALSYTAPERSRFQYQLVGFDSAWVDTDRDFAAYTNLDPGDYTFRVRSANRHGTWGEPVELAIAIARPPWLRWWAFAAYGAVVLALVFVWWRWQRAKLERLKTHQRLESAEKDLALTAAVQNGFLPDSPSHEHEDIRLYGFWRPAAGCSGDLWCYEQQDSGRVLVLVGDVTGHGPGPAMVTAAVATAFRITRALPLIERVDILNQEVQSVGKDEYHMTLAGIELEPRTGAFKYVNAGAPPMFALQPEAARPKAMVTRGTPLGSKGFHLGVIDGVLNTATRVVLYTDGIPEVSDTQGRLFGLRRFSGIFASTKEMSLIDASRSIVSAADDFRAQTVQNDDWTMVMIERYR